MCKLKLGQTLSVADTTLSKEILNVGHPKIPKDTFTNITKKSLKRGNYCYSPEYEPRQKTSVITDEGTNEKDNVENESKNESTEEDHGHVVNAIVSTGERQAEH